MFEVGFTELLLIFALALVVLGPEKLPRVAAQVGRWIGRARAMARQFREQLESEADLESLAKKSSTRRPTTTVDTPEANPPSDLQPTPSPYPAEADAGLQPSEPVEVERYETDESRDTAHNDNAPQVEVPPDPMFDAVPPPADTPEQLTERLNERGP